MMQRFIGLMIFLGGVIGAYFCLVNVQWQDDAVRRFEGVPAVLQETHVERHHHSKGSDTYSPEASYTYNYAGQTYSSTRVLPLSNDSNRTWAEGVLRRIERAPEGGKGATAYVNPRKPSEAVLVREYSFAIYGVGMGAMGAAALGLGMVLGVVGSGRTKMEAVALDDSGWRLLLPVFQMRKALKRGVMWFVGATAAVVVMPGHWFFVAGQFGTAGLISGGIALGVVGVFGTIAFRRWSVSRHLSDARLRIRPAPMRRGECLALDVGIDAQMPLRVSSMTAKVVCLEHYKERRGSKTYYGTRTHVEKVVPLCGAREVKAGEEIAGQGEVVFEGSAPPSTEVVEKVYPYYTWEVRLALVLEGAVDYAAVFPLEVE